MNTRWLMLLMLVVTVTGNFGMAPMELLYFDPEKVLKFQVGCVTLRRSTCIVCTYVCGDATSRLECCACIDLANGN